jgi:hypothetical protein
MQRKKYLANACLAICGFALTLAACASVGQPDSTFSSSPYLIEPVFLDFYNFLGGQTRLGPALSPVIVEGNVQRQYLENALMIYNPELPPSEQYSLAPIGQQMGVWDEPLASTDLQGVLFVEGYIVYEGFVSLYQELGAQRYVGRPLTGVRYDADQNRVEQYFENLGFFQNLDDPDSGVQLIPYGRVACAGTCGAQANPAAIIQIELPYGEPFVGTVARLGDGFVGPRLAGPYKKADGSLEVIYQNLVLFANADGSQQATPRPIVAELGIEPEPFVSRLDNPNLMFYGIEGELGYNVPLFFTDYIGQHGGFEIFGQPISELRLQDDGSASQCFANTCLRFATGFGVQPVPVGVQYKTRFYDQPAIDVPAEQTEIRIQVWEDFSQISSAETQVIHATLFAGSQLLAGLQPYLEITLPGGGTSIYQFPTSDVGGQSQLSVPPIHAQNGTLIPYKVCLEGFGSTEVCASESYMIWGN